MTQSTNGKTRTFIAGGSINANKAVRLSASEDNTIHHATAATVIAIGVAQHSASDGKVVTVQMDGTTKLVAGRAITKGRRVACAAGGKAVHTTTANDAVLGIALETVTDTTGVQVFEVDLTPRGSNM